MIEAIGTQKVTAIAQVTGVGGGRASRPLSLLKESGHPTSRATAQVRECSYGNQQKKVHPGIQTGSGASGYRLWSKRTDGRIRTLD